MTRRWHARSLALGVLAVCLPAMTATAQTNYGKRKATRQLTLGAAFGVGASMILSPPPGAKVKPIFAWRGTAEASYPLTETVGTALGLGLDSRGYSLHPDGAPEDYVDTRITYFTFTPGFTFSAFYIGMNIAMPMSGTASSEAATSDISDAEMDNFTTLLEPRVGAIIPLMDEETGWMGLTILGGASLNEMVDRADVSGDESDYHMVSLHLGLTYQFAIPGTKR